MMRKLITLLVVLGFFVGVVSSSEAAVKKAPVKKPLAKRVMVKKVVAKKVVKKAVLKAPVAPPPPPPPPPVAPIPPRPPVAVKAAPSAGLFGWGINTLLTGSYINTGKGSLSGTGLIRGDWVMDDMMGLGSKLGLASDSVKYTLGLGVAYGGGGMKAIPLFLGGIIKSPAKLMGGSPYLSGGLNYVLYGNGRTTGKLGGEANIGLLYDLGLGFGQTGFQLGWSTISSNSVTSSGLQLSVCQPITL